MIRQEFYIVISGSDDGDLLFRGVFDDPETGGEVKLHLQQGGWEHQGEMLVETYQGDSNTQHISVLPDQKLAVGYLIAYLEQLGIDENSAWEWVRQSVDVSRYEKWVESLSMQDRRERLLEQGEESKGEDPAIEKAVEVGEWRDTDLGSESTDIVKELVEEVDRNGRKCYETAQNEIEAAWEYEERVKYCEGYALPRQGVRATRHAWVEIDGSVFELTWPWHAPVDDDAVYYGTVIPRDVLEERMRDRGSDPMIFDDGEYEEYLDLIESALS